MNKLVIQKIKSIADNLNSKYNKDAVPPIIAEKIMLAEGLRLGFKHLPNSRVALLDRQAKTIFLTDNRDLVNKWGNFAIAHELGHWFLHENPTDYFTPSLIVDQHSNKEDKEANYFASFLLMPDNLMKDWDWLDPEIFSSAFNVPKESVELRKSIFK